MTRRSESTRVALIAGMARNAVVRWIGWQTPYSAVSALLSGVLVVTFAADLLAGSSRVDRGTVAYWLVSYGVLTLLPLVLGRRYPRGAGIFVVAYVTVWSASFLLFTEPSRIEVNALLELPMIALYLGWFWSPRIARGVLLSSVTIVASAAVLRAVAAESSASVMLMTAGYAVIISGFCLEAGSFVRRRLEREAQRDPLTAVLNRRGLVERSRRMLAHARRNELPLTLAVIDFDDFKQVNDTGGHAAGDAALCEVSEAWVAGLARGDLVARSGGDEFVLMMGRDLAAAESTLAVLRATSPHAWSWGLAAAGRGDTLDQLMSRADAELYRAKERRTGREPRPGADARL